MEYKNKSFVKIKVNARVSKMFRDIIEDIPLSCPRTENTALIVRPQTSLISYEEFYNIIYKCVLTYIPSRNQNTLMIVVKNLPNVLKNVKRIGKNKNIIDMQRKILDKYFYISGDMNIKEKIDELKFYVDDLIESEDLEDLDSVLNNFEERMRDYFLNDMKSLADLLEKR